uniref:Uncharacterized protein n=1 Tax=Leersia perrieri TaxID=77586 RepID=A0A0D9XC92_9ORYZ
MNSENYQTTIDVVSSLVDELMVASCPRCDTIKSGCKIPWLNEEDEPGVVCIGPYYHDPLHRNEQEKRLVLHNLLPVDEKQKVDKLRRLFEAVYTIEKEARGHYVDHPWTMDSAEFVQMLVLDGCYILGKFVLPHCCHPAGLSVSDGKGADFTGSPALSDSCSQVSSSIQSAGMGMAAKSNRRGHAMRNVALVRDVFCRLDNQIPFCVLDTIHKVLHGNKMSGSCTLVADTVARQLRELLQNLSYSVVGAKIHKPWHLNHLLHMHFQPVSVDEKPNAAAAAAARVYRWRSATQYHAAGVRFKTRHLDGGGARSILDVELDGLTLRMPSLTVDNNTCTILRNLMNLEQHNPEIGSHVTAYCVFMSQLAGTAHDVELLARKGIIVHALLTDSHVAEMLASLCSGITIDLDEPRHSYLHKTRKALERLYQSRRVHCMTLPRRNPWLVLALFAAIVALLCNLLQAIYIIKTYYRT